MSIEDAINLIFSGNCVLFLGAGYSYQAENVMENGIPMASELSKLLDEESGEDSDWDLSLAAQSYIEIKGEYQIVEFLKNTFRAVGVKESQEELGKYSWKRVYTTNYDDVFEFSALKNKKRSTSITLSDRLREFKIRMGLLSILMVVLLILQLHSFLRSLNLQIQVILQPNLCKANG